MNGMSPGGWQNYTPNQDPRFMANSPMTQPITMPQSQFPQNQNGGIMQGPQPTFLGRFVDRIDEVLPAEVPMDGRVALFPSKSLDSMWLRAWNKDGQLMTFHYILDPNQGSSVPQPTQTDNFQSQIMERLDELERRLGEANKGSNRRNTKGGDE